MSTSAPSEASALEQKFLADLDARLEELQPVVEEANRLMDLRTRVSGTNQGRSTRQSRPRGRPRASSGANGDGAGVKPGSRLAQLVDVVKANPGVSVADVAKKMGIAPNYIYRLRNQGEAAGVLRTEDGGGLVVLEEQTAA